MAPLAVIPDASVGVKWVVEEPDSDKARYVRDLTLGGTVRLVVPTLFYYEVANAVRYSDLAGPEEEEELLRKVHAADLGEVPPERDRMLHAVARAHQIGCTVYDAAYLVVAEELPGVVVTADARFARKADSPHVVTLAKAYDDLRDAHG